MIDTAEFRSNACACSILLYSLAAMVLNVVLRLVPTRVNAAIAATAINAAINVYLIAVTPDSSLTKFLKKTAQWNSPRFNKSNRALGCHQIFK